MIVMKFGGTSVGDMARMDQVAALCAAESRPVVAVVSAMGGTTDALLQAGACAESGDFAGGRVILDQIGARHRAVASDDAVTVRIERMLAEAEDLLQGIALLREQTPRSRALLASFGERLSAPLVAARLRALGRAAADVDAREILRTDTRYEAAQVQLGPSRELVRARLLPLLDQGVVPVVTGFIASSQEGATTLLGRGGSDYSGALIGALLDAEEIWIWTDVDGILTADPRLVRDARPLERVSYREAAEMSYFGAKVVHPKTMLPAAERGIPLRIRSTFEPHRLGTLISEDSSEEPFGVKTVTAVRKQSLLTVEGRGLAGVPGTARRIFGVTEAADVSVVMISQASSEQAVSLVVPEHDGSRLRDRLEEAFLLERRAGLLDPIRLENEVAVISAVGQGMAGTPGISARLFRALGRTGVNVRAIAQGANELSISAAIQESDVPRAVRAVHAAFGLTQRVDLAVFGTGRVARAFVAMLAANRDELARTRGIALRVLSVANRSSVWFDEHGDAGDAWQEGRPGLPRPDDLDLLDQIDRLRHGPCVIVDLTGSNTTALHVAAVDRGLHVATANKIPLSGALTDSVRLRSARARTGAQYGFETTFGAGLPVLHTLQELIATGDRIERVSGCFSGTLGFLSTQLQDGQPLAAAVQTAAELGYTEPDPRDDLSGLDVARKALIIGRAMGLPLEPEDVKVDPFVAGLERGLAEALAAEGEGMSARVVRARERGAVLRYVASVDREGARVGLVEVDASSPIGSLRGPDNILVFQTARYRDYPLVVRGPGAGAEVTAAGVLGDVLRIAGGADGI